MRRSALALGLPWPAEPPYAEVISALDPDVPEAAALLTYAGRLLRGAAYTAFDGAPPEQPLAQRRRRALRPLHRAAAPPRRPPRRRDLPGPGRRPEPPAWARQALPALPATMAGATRRAQELERAVVDLAEAVVLAPRLHETFDAVVVESGDTRGVVQLREPAVRARCQGADLPLGQELRVRLAEVDVAARRVVFVPA